ncbi:MAG: transcription elongation factor GreA, partial [Subtercola sp.]|nr:transcription elongation factor GreA [Subtercola sp.]
MADEAEVSWLTQAAYDRLVNELEYATTTGRQEITDK